MKRLVLSLLIVPILAGALILWFLNSPPSRMDHQIIRISRGASVHAIATSLKQQNLITSVDFFKAISYLKPGRSIGAGKYRIHKDMTSVEIFDRLASGEVITRKVTIPEGFNIYQIGRRLNDEGITSEKKFLFYAENRNFLKSLKIKAPSVEGYLFPDTYIFPEDSDPRDIIIIMYKKTRQTLRDLQATVEASPEGAALSTHRLLSLASLIEKEAKVRKEQVYISSVFHNRLQKNWRLDCDPTVRYAVKRFTGPIYLSDLKKDSPYNTYRRKGLPPTPICSPGREAIAAALKPAKTRFFFFVARNDGSHYFSKTLREHNRAEKFYQRNEAVSFTDNQRL